MKKWLARRTTIFLGSVLVLGAGTLFFMQSRQIKQQSQQLKASDTSSNHRSPTITMKNITLHEYEKKRGYEFVMTAQEGTFYHASDNVECSDFSCNVLQHGVCLAQINAHKSFIDRMSKQIFFQGTIEGTWKDLDIQGADIGYNFSSQTIKTEKTMIYTHPLFNFSAHQSTINIATESIEMSNGVRTEFSCTGIKNNAH